MAVIDSDRAAEPDLEAALAALELPGIAVVEPGLRQLDLPAVRDLLAEHAVDVADAVAVGRHVDRRHALHEARGQPSETAIAERGVGLERGDQVHVDAEPGERLAHGVEQAEIGEGVAHQAADQELERQIVDALGLVVVGLLGGFDPAFDDAVAHDGNRCGQPVVRGRHGGVLADPVAKAGQDLGRQICRVGIAHEGPFEFDRFCRPCHFRLKSAAGRHRARPHVCVLSSSRVSPHP